MSGNINWYRVEQACRRGKLGRMTVEDQRLVEEAYAADPETYSKVSREGAAAAVREFKEQFEGR